MLLKIEKKISNNKAIRNIGACSQLKLENCWCFRRFSQLSVYKCRKLNNFIENSDHILCLVRFRCPPQSIAIFVCARIQYHSVSKMRYFLRPKSFLLYYFDVQIEQIDSGSHNFVGGIKISHAEHAKKQPKIFQYIDPVNRRRENPNRCLVSFKRMFAKNQQSCKIRAEEW